MRHSKSYVAQFSKKYVLLNNGFNGTLCTGAIVKRSADLHDFDAFVIAVLANSEIELKKEAALQFLFDEGYLSRRQYSGIEDLLIRANALRHTKGAT